MGLRNRIRELREQQGLSLQQVVEKLNMPTVDSSRLSKLERADDVSLEWMERLAPTFGVYPTEIVDDTPRGVSPVPTVAEAKLYEPRRKNDVLQSLVAQGHAVWEVLVDSLGDLQLQVGAHAVVEKVTQLASLATGDPVIAIYTGDTGELPLLRQFIEPSLLITNRETGNAVPLNLRRDPVRIVGRIVHRIHSARR